MPFPIQTNPDLPLSWRIPGTYIAINLNNPGSAPGIRLLLLGELATGNQRQPNVLYRANSEQDVIDGSGSLSILRPMFNSAITQIGAGNLEIWIGHVSEASGGAVGVYEHLVGGPATGAGMINWLFCGKTASASFANGDSATTIGSALATAASTAFGTMPVASVSAASGLITMTLKTKAAWGEDMKSQFYVTPGKGVSIGPGTYAYATNATGAGTATLVCGRTTYTATVSNSDTPTTIAAAVAALLVGDGPLTGTAATGTLTPTYQNDYPVAHVTAKIVTSTGTTINVNSRGAVAAGTNSPNGVIATGSPTLTTLLANIDAQTNAFKAWASPWNDTTALGTIDTLIESEGGGGGGQQRGQRLVASSTDAIATATAIPTGTSPALTASVRAVVDWVALESLNPGWQFTARVAAAIAANQRYNKNFNGLVLKSSAADPLIGPSSAAAISPQSDINSAINLDFLAPIAWSPALGAFTVIHARTTSNSLDRRLHKWSLIAQLDAQRDYIRIAINKALSTADGTGVSLMLSGTPFSEGIIQLSDIEDIVFRCTVEMEALGFYDGAEANKSGIKAVQNQSDPGRIDLIYTAAGLVDVDQVSAVANRGSATQ